MDSPYTLRTCAGVAEMSGRGTKGFVVESLDGATKVSLPTLIKCNNVPEDKDDISIPEVAQYHPHLNSIVYCILPFNPEAGILLMLVF